MENQFFKLPVTFDAVQMARDLAACEASQWIQHFNKHDYNGTWTGIALRSATGKSADIYAHAKRHSEGNGFVDTELLDQCPYFREILDSFQCEKQTVRLLSLLPGSHIKEHRDRGLSYGDGVFRLHIPIETDAGVQFRVAGTDLNMLAGECWYANFDLPHSVHHRGAVRRVHLVLDCERNAWTDDVFREAGYSFEAENRPPVYDDRTRQQMIEHLQQLNTPAALEIIKRLNESPS